VRISGFVWNVLPFLSVLVFSGIKTGSIRVSTSSIETYSSVNFLQGLSLISLIFLVVFFGWVQNPVANFSRD